MSREHYTGTCDKCGEAFQYYLIHNGFNESAFAYSDSDSYVALLDGWKVPIGISLRPHDQIEQTIENYLSPSPLGGLFRSGASPRCPSCNQPMDPEKAADYIERDAPGTAKGWRWQRSWNGVYCIVINDMVVHDNWKTPNKEGCRQLRDPGGSRSCLTSDVHKNI